MIKLSTLKTDPSNPRKIDEKDFEQLKKSLQTFPRMMELRPIVIDETGTVKAGNQRLKALKELGYKEIDDLWVKKAIDFTPQQLREFMLKDNDHAGEFDWEILKDDWDSKELVDWGIANHSTLPDQEPEPPPPGQEQVSFTKTKTAFIKIVFKTPKQLQKAESEVKLLLEKYKGANYSVSAGGKQG